MSDAAFNLKNPPIVEAVLDIECDLPPGQQVAALETPARERFRDRYPTFRTQRMQEFQIQTKPGGTPEHSVRQAVQALQFLQEDEKQLIQIRAQGFSFNRLAPYTGLDDYLPEIERTWHLYIGLASPIQIRSIRMRYINRIPLPSTAGIVNLETFFKISPRLPDEEKLKLVGFLNQHTAVEVETGNQVNIVMTGQAPEGDKFPIIFDIGVAALESGDPANWPWIFEKIRVLRNLKNLVFRETLTETCLNIFR